MDKYYHNMLQLLNIREVHCTVVYMALFCILTVPQTKVVSSSASQHHSSADVDTGSGGREEEGLVLATGRRRSGRGEEERVGRAVGMRRMFLRTL